MENGDFLILSLLVQKTLVHLLLKLITLVFMHVIKLMCFYVIIEIIILSQQSQYTVLFVGISLFHSFHCYLKDLPY